MSVNGSVGRFFQVDLASEERLLIRTTAFVEELRKRMYTKVNTGHSSNWMLLLHYDIIYNEATHPFCQDVRSAFAFGL
jgi:hypothetical protein